MIRENSYAVKFQSFSKEQPQVRVIKVKGTLKDTKKIGGLRGLYLHYCYKLGILPKKKLSVNDFEIASSTACRATLSLVGRPFFSA